MPITQAPIPTGTILPYGGASAPAGWLLCDGSAVSRTTQAGLFAVLGTAFGTGDGSTTFNVPDLRGRIPLGIDNMGGSAASRITSASTNGANATTRGGSGGAETHTLATAEMPAHTHTYFKPHDFTAANAGASGEPKSEIQSNTGSEGSGSAHSNTQPWLAVNYIVKT